MSVKQGDNEYGVLKTWKIMSPLLTTAMNFPARSEVKGYKVGSVNLTVPAPQEVLRQCSSQCIRVFITLRFRLVTLNTSDLFE